MAAMLVSYLKHLLKNSTILDSFHHTKGDVPTGRDSHHLLDKDCVLWNDDIGSMLAEMLELADYPTPSKDIHNQFFQNSVAVFLGHHPRGTSRTPHVWKSFMTDDHTPVELSWCWSSSDKKTPAVRYSVEPISRSANRGDDGANVDANIRMLGEALLLAPNMDLCLHRHFRQILTTRVSTPHRASSNPERNSESQVPQSQCFIAFDLLGNDMVVKQYYLPGRRARELGCSNWHLIKESVQNIPETCVSLRGSAFSTLVEFMDSFSPTEQPVAEILAIDCVDPNQSRVKIYCRSRETSFLSVIDMLSIGGRKPLSPKALDGLWKLWLSVLGLSVESYPSPDQPLPGVTHRTGGILYYYELKAGSKSPKSKVYLPVRHYAQSDDQIARGLSEYLEERGKGFSAGSYHDSVRKLCKHRNLADGLGFHTYVSWAGEGDNWNVTAYLNPETYTSSS